MWCKGEKHGSMIILTDYLHSMTIKCYLQVHLSGAILRAPYWTSSGRSKRNKFNMAYHSTALKQKSPASIMQLRDGSLFMGMTGSGKNWMGFENFSCRGDGLCVFFLEQRDRALKKNQNKLKLC